MGLQSTEGFCHSSLVDRRLLCSTHTRQDQYHVDVVGRPTETTSLYRWCLATFGPPSKWHPRRVDAQWYNRFDTDLMRPVNLYWTCRPSPWVGGDIKNLHLVLWDGAAAQFEAQWRGTYFR